MQQFVIVMFDSSIHYFLRFVSAIVITVVIVVWRVGIYCPIVDLFLSSAALRPDEMSAERRDHVIRSDIIR